MAEQILGVILAGGLARRFGGGDKCLIELDGKPLLDHVIARAAPQVDRLLLNANGDPARFQSYGLEVVADVVEGYAGPLAGVLTALEWARDHAPDVAWVASFAADAPLVPTDVVARMVAAIGEQGADMACAMSDARTHPVMALWPVSIAPALRAALVDEDLRKIDKFTARYKTIHVDFPFTDFDPFLNINTPEELEQATRLLKGEFPVKPNFDLPTSHRVGIVVERRDSKNPWSDGSWHAVAVLADVPANDAWKLLEQGEGWQRYYAGSLALELFRRETADYKVNLSQPAPKVYLVLRPGEGEGDPQVSPLLATFSPYEAESYEIGGDMIVDAVAMPDSLAAWLAAFVEAYHIDEPFKKRKQKRKDDTATGRGPKD
ncbi:MAG TPA: molybdenum cofactor guanylyltransferase MobA, partial [Magnetovibrio sp.]